MASRIPPLPLRQIYFGQDPILIEKSLKSWLKDPAKLEKDLNAWLVENAKIMGENQALKKAMSDKNQEIADLKNGFDAERIKWGGERAKLQNQVNNANLVRDNFVRQLNESRVFIKKTYVWLGNYGTNPPLVSLDQLKILLRKVDNPRSSKDYYTLFELVAIIKLHKFLQSYSIKTAEEVEKTITDYYNLNNKVNWIVDKWQANPRTLTQLDEDIRILTFRKEQLEKEIEEAKKDLQKHIARDSIIKTRMVREINLLQTKLKADKTLSQEQINSYLDKMDDLQTIVDEKEGIISDKEQELIDLREKYLLLWNSVYTNLYDLEIRLDTPAPKAPSTSSTGT